MTTAYQHFVGLLDPTCVR